MQKLYHLWYVDLKARRRFQVWTIVIAFTYGVINSIVLHRPEKEVTWETLGVVGLMTVAFSVFYCLRADTSKETKVSLDTQLGEFFRENQTVLKVGLVAVIVVLASFVASRVPNTEVQAAGLNIRLERAAYSSKPYDANTINELTTVFDTAAAKRLPLKSQLVTKAGKSVVGGSSENSGAWPAALAFLNYRSTLNEEVTVPPQESPCIGTEKLSGIGSIIEGLEFVGCNGQALDHVAWREVVFKDSSIVYHGGPVDLDRVQFQNCRFVFDYSPAGQKLAQALAASNTVTIKLP
jgi:hypothetical protein